MWKTKAFAIAAAVSLGLAQAQAAELKVFVGGAMTETVSKIGADFARGSGHKLEFISDTTGALVNKLKAGEKADVIVVTEAAIDGLQKEGALAQGSRTALVRALVGVAVKAGSTTAPDLSSVDAFKQSLLKAKTVSYVDPKAGGTSGTYFEGLLARMGIAEQMKSKTVYRTQGAGVADAVATGAAELGITFIAELSPNKGVKIAGPLPNEIQLPTNYVAGVLTVSANQDASRAFIQAMKAPGGEAVFKGAGLQPLTAAR
jgi:molybdate transport system substrate-binding protein